MQALELTNGATLDARLQKAALKFLQDEPFDSAQWLDSIYQHALSRPPTDTERQLAREILGPQPKYRGRRRRALGAREFAGVSVDQLTVRG